MGVRGEERERRERGRERGKERDGGGDRSERGREGKREKDGGLVAPEGRWESVQLKLKFARERKIEKEKSRSTNT